MNLDTYLTSGYHCRSYGAVGSVRMQGTRKTGARGTSLGVTCNDVRHCMVFTILRLGSGIKQEGQGVRSVDY